MQQTFPNPCEVCGRQGIHSGDCDYRDASRNKFPWGKQKGRNIYETPMPYLTNILKFKGGDMDRTLRNEIMRRVHNETETVNGLQFGSDTGTEEVYYI